MDKLAQSYRPSVNNPFIVSLTLLLSNFSMNTENKYTHRVFDKGYPKTLGQFGAQKRTDQ